MKLADILEFLKQKLSSENNQGEEVEKDVFQKEFEKRKSFSRNVPRWARLDWFARKDLGTMKPPEELEEDFSIAKKILGPKSAPIDLKKRRKSHASKSLKPGASKEEIDSFLEDFLNPSDTPKK